MPLKPTISTLALTFMLIPTLASAQKLPQSSKFIADDTRTIIPEKVKGNNKDWALDLSVGGNYSQGNIEQISGNTRISALKSWKNSSVYALGDMTFIQFGGKTFQNRGSIRLRYDHHLFNKNIKFFAYNTHSYNEFISLDYRLTSGIGPWLDYNLGPLKSSSSAAIAYEREHYKSPAPIENNFRLSLRHITTLALDDHTDLGLDFFFVPKVNDFTDFRIFSMAYINFKFLQDRFSFKMAVTDEFDSRPGNTNIKNNDLAVMGTLTLHLGQ